MLMWLVAFCVHVDGIHGLFYGKYTLCKKASNHHANLPLEMYSFTL